MALSASSPHTMAKKDSLRRVLSVTAEAKAHDTGKFSEWNDVTLSLLRETSMTGCEGDRLVKLFLEKLLFVLTNLRCQLLPLSQLQTFGENQSSGS